MTYKTLVNNVCTNDATVEAVAVALTLHSWATTAVISTINAGKATRVWWETDDAIAPLIRLIGEIIWLAAVLCWQYFASGQAKKHWVFVNAVVDDGLGVYGRSPMGDSLSAWIRKQVRCTWVASRHTALYVLQRVSHAAVARYGEAQERVFVV